MQTTQFPLNESIMNPQNRNDLPEHQVSESEELRAETLTAEAVADCPELRAGEVSWAAPAGLVAAVVALLALVPGAWATALPVGGAGFGGMFFDFAINQILHGPIGFTMGVGFIISAVIFTGMSGMKSPIGLGMLLAGIGFLKAPDLVATISGSIF